MEPNLHFRGMGMYLGGRVCYARGLLPRAMPREIRVLWQMAACCWATAGWLAATATAGAEPAGSGKGLMAVNWSRIIDS